MGRVSWTIQALDDLDAICEFIARDVPRYAQVFALKIFEATDRLESFPLSGRMVPEIGKEEIREIIFGNYRIVYRVLKDEVEIITVHHGAKLLDPQKIITSD